VTTGLTGLLQHRDPACTAGFSAVIEEVPDWLEDVRRPTHLELRCWACSTVWKVNAYTPATDDPETEDYRPPREHTPSLSHWSSDLRLPASLISEKHGPVMLHPESVLRGWGGDPYEWLVTDLDGNVLGTVARYHTRRDAIRYRCGLLQQGTLSEGFKTPGAAARSLGEAAGVSRTLAATG
jgi:hypothetical protein